MSLVLDFTAHKMWLLLCTNTRCRIVELSFSLKEDKASALAWAKFDLQKMFLFSYVMWCVLDGNLISHSMKIVSSSFKKVPKRDFTQPSQTKLGLVENGGSSVLRRWKLKASLCRGGTPSTLKIESDSASEEVQQEEEEEVQREIGPTHFRCLTSGHLATLDFNF